MSWMPYGDQRKPIGTPLDDRRRKAVEEVRRRTLAALDGYDAEVWLFGSCARGDVHSCSDIDVGVVAHGPVPPGFWDGEVGGEDIGEVTPFPVGIADLKDKRQPPELLAEVLQEGVRWR